MTPWPRLTFKGKVVINFVKYVYLITSNVHVQIRIIFKQNTFALGNI